MQGYGIGIRPLHVLPDSAARGDDRPRAAPLKQAPIGYCAHPPASSLDGAWCRPRGILLVATLWDSEAKTSAGQALEPELP